MKLLIDNDNVVIVTDSDIISDDNKKGFYIKSLNTVYPFSLNLTLVETDIKVPDDLVGGKYLFNNDTFSLNPNYEEPVDVEAQLKLQAKQIEALTFAMLQS